MAQPSPSWNGAAWNQLGWGGSIAASTAPRLLLTATLKATLIPTPSPPSWTTIDAARTQELPPSYGT